MPPYNVPGGRRRKGGGSSTLSYSIVVLGTTTFPTPRVEVDLFFFFPIVVRMMTPCNCSNSSYLSPAAEEGGGDEYRECSDLWIMNRRVTTQQSRYYAHTHTHTRRHSTPRLTD